MHEDDLLVERYRLVRKLGVGAMGQVWLAHDTLLNRHVAVKHLLIETPRSLTEEPVQRAMREARLAAQLNHANAVQIYDLIIDEFAPYVVMEYVDGQTLAARLQSTGPMAPRELRPVVRQIATALAAAHGLGIVHRDVKPANILLASNGGVKLADFGIARSGQDPNLTSTGLVVGTLAYMAPEVAAGDPATPASDVWALGATAYAATEGRAPFAGESSARMLYRKVSEAPPVPGRAGELADLMRAMMATEPGERPAAREIVRALDGAGPPSWSGAVPPEPAAQTHVRAVPVAEQTVQRSVTPRASAPGATPPHPGYPTTQGQDRARGGRAGWVAAAAVLILAVAGGATAVVLATRSGHGSNAAAPNPSATLDPTHLAPNAATDPTPSVTDVSPTTTPPSTVSTPTAAVAAPNADVERYIGPGGLSAEGPASWDNRCPDASDPYYWCAGAQGFLGGYFRLRLKTARTSSFDADVRSELTYFQKLPAGTVDQSDVTGWSVSADAVDLTYSFRNSQGVERQGIERIFTGGGPTVSTYVIGTTDVPANFARTQRVFSQLVASAEV